VVVLDAGFSVTPMDVHAVVDQQEMLVSSTTALVPPSGGGTPMFVQVVPASCHAVGSAVPVDVLTLSVPTARHDVADWQDTAKAAERPISAGVDVVTVDPSTMYPATAYEVV
jgi:hypothetical protein